MISQAFVTCPIRGFLTSRPAELGGIQEGLLFTGQGSQWVLLPEKEGMCQASKDGG